MKATLLKELLGHKADPCLTVILDTNQESFADKEKIEIHLKKALKQAENELKGRKDNGSADRMIKELNAMAGKIDLNSNQKGIGIYISPDLIKLVSFPFQVKTRTVVDTSFDIKDVISNVNKLIDYKVLLLSKGNTRFFKGSGSGLEEVHDENFPNEYEEQFQFPTIRPARPGQQFYSNEQSKVNQNRLEDFLRSMDRDLKDYLGRDEPLVVVGVDKMLSTFKSLSEHASNIKGSVEGNYDWQTPAEIADKAWPVIQEYQQEEANEALAAAKDKLYTERAVSGIQAVWEIIHLERGETLFIERDFNQKAFTDEFRTRIVLDKPVGDATIEVRDAVEEAIEHLVQQQGTHVYMVENGELKDHGSVILTTRY